MPDMTEEEAARLDKYYTENTAETVRGKPGTFARHRARMLEFDLSRRGEPPESPKAVRKQGVAMR